MFTSGKSSAATLPPLRIHVSLSSFSAANLEENGTTALPA
jgi:hypothetical protein